jgi:hypothetical protein
LDKRDHIEGEREPDRTEGDRMRSGEALSIEKDGAQELQGWSDELEHSQRRIAEPASGRREQDERNGRRDAGEKQEDHVLVAWPERRPAARDELGHITISVDGLLAEGQPVPRCNCGNSGDVESVASLTGILKNLLPFWLTRYPDHPLHEVADPVSAARQVRKYAERGDELALKVFGQQAMAIGRLFTIAANFSDPAVYFVGGGVVESAPHFREWFLQVVRANTSLRAEQARVAEFATVPDLDMAGARGSAFAALEQVRGS